MNLLDAYALIAFLSGGPATAEVRALLREGKTAVASVHLAETLDVCQRIRGLPVSRVMEILEPLFDGPLAVISLDVETARRAAEIRAAHYHRSARPLSLADAVLLASAKPRDRIVTADPHALAVAEAEGIDSLALPEQA